MTTNADAIIRRSPEQVQKRIQKIRTELIEHGLTVVRTEFLQSLMDKVDEKTSTVASDNRRPSKDAAR